ncbi:hypothetical protein D6829_01200 [Candidatus Pacearchaeota archaeon]|nr:MAG: hypothetical protein D6829_01200 [Candidatus Pacearchaeota archaeon]
MKKGLAVLFVMFFLSFASASVKVYSKSIKDNYTSTGYLEGKVSLELSNVDLQDKIILKGPATTEKNIKDSLESLGLRYSCNPRSCKQRYSKGSKVGSTIKIDGGKFVGVLLSGEDVSLNDLDLSVSSDFKESDVPPLSINFFGYVYDFLEPSSSYGGVDISCFNKNEKEKGPPLLSSRYCNEVVVGKTGRIFLSAEVYGVDNKALEMSINSPNGRRIGACVYNPSESRGCEINLTNIDPEASYLLCVRGSSTKYFLYKSPGSCGRVIQVSSKVAKYGGDFGIKFWRAKFKDASAINLSSYLQNILQAAKSFLKKEYGGDCSSGCILPIIVEGIKQNLSINLNLQGSNKKGDFVEENLYYLVPNKATLDFNGTIDLSKLKLRISESGKYYLYIAGKKIATIYVSIEELPKIIEIYPKIVPAGIPVRLFARTENLRKSNTFKWVIDNHSLKSQESSAEYTFENIGVKRVRASILDNGKEIARYTTNIRAASPAEAVNKTLERKKESFSKFSSALEKLDKFVKEAIKNKINYSFYVSRLASFKKRANNTDKKKMVPLVKELYAFQVPDSLIQEKEKAIPAYSSAEINAVPLLKFAKLPVKSSTTSDYAEAISRWQQSNTEISAYSTKFIATFPDKKVTTFTLYDIIISKFSDDDAFLVISAPPGNLVFENQKPTASGEYSLIKLKDSDMRIRFYTEESEVSFFASPDIRSIILGSSIDKSCNFNGVCEKGETPSNCRSDCKPTKMAVVYLFMVILVALVIYTFLQEWYKKNYESHLFPERPQLYNLLMFISNARARGMSDKQISRELSKFGWSSEKIAYALKKSRGERVGLPEIIPIEKIRSRLRNKKAEKNYMETGFKMPPPRMIHPRRF